MSFEAINIKNNIGSEVRGSAETLLRPDVARQLRELLVQRGVLIFRELNLSDEQQVKLASMMGSVREEGENGIFKISLDKNTNAKGDYLKGSFLWHMDGTHDQIPVFASLLTGLKLSPVGGQTEFANSYAAYNALSNEMKERIAQLKVVHSVETSMRRASIEPTAENIDYWRSIPDRTHKLVWTHSCGRKSLVVGCHADHVEGMQYQAGQKLIQELIDWATQDDFVYRHEWTVGDLVIWDNTGVLHRAEPYPIDSGREMHRTTLMGEEAFS